MNYEALLRKKNRVVKVGIAGIGDFGAGLLASSKKIAGRDIILICDKDRNRMDAALSACGMNSDGVAMVEKLEDGQDVPSGMLLQWEMLDAERTGVLHKLRIRQDRFFNLTE